LQAPSPDIGREELRQMANENTRPGRVTGFVGCSGARQMQLIRPVQTQERKKCANGKRGKRAMVTQRGPIP